MKFPDSNIASQLVNRQSEHGFISAYIDLDPADRSEAWRIKLKNGLDEIVAIHVGREYKSAAQRVLDHLPAPGDKHSSGRYRIGFVEVTAEPDQDIWFDLQAPAVPTIIRHDYVPYLPPLVKLLDQAPTVGAAVVSAERVELYEWQFGVIEPVGEMLMDVAAAADSRESKGPTIDPSRGTQVSSSGRDQFDQRIEDQRVQFLTKCGEDTAKTAQRRKWSAVACFGDEARFRSFAHRVSNDNAIEFVHAGDDNLIGHGLQAIADHTSRHIAAAETAREVDLVERAKAAGLARDGRGVLGVQATVDCLLDGRVSHLLYDSTREYEGELVDGHLTFMSQTDSSSPGSKPALTDRILSQALTSGAKITPLEGKSAAALAEFDGMAALLRF